MSASTLLGRLEGVRSRGPGKWSARCPSHKDRSPSLSIAEAEDGRVLIHCFAGCGADDVLGAIGLSFADVMPERLGEFSRERQPFPAAQALEMCAKEVMVAAFLAVELGHLHGSQRLIEAASRLNAALVLLNIEPMSLKAVRRQQ